MIQGVLIYMYRSIHIAQHICNLVTNTYKNLPPNMAHIFNYSKAIAPSEAPSDVEKMKLCRKLIEAVDRGSSIEVVDILHNSSFCLSKYLLFGHFLPFVAISQKKWSFYLCKKRDTIMQVNIVQENNISCTKFYKPIEIFWFIHHYITCCGLVASPHKRERQFNL